MNVVLLIIINSFSFKLPGSGKTKGLTNLMSIAAVGCGEFGKFDAPQAQWIVLHVRL